MYAQIRNPQQQQGRSARSVIPQQNARPPTRAELESAYGKDLVTFFSSMKKEGKAKSLLSIRKDFLFLANTLDAVDCEKYGITHILLLSQGTETAALANKVETFELSSEDIDVDDFVEVATGFVQSVGQQVWKFLRV